MSICLLDADEAERFRVGINIDQEFKIVGRDMTLNLVIEIGTDQRLLKVRDGEVKGIGRNIPMTDPVDVYISGASEFWKNLLSPVPPTRFQNLYAATHAGNCEVAGNHELFNAYFPAINRMIDVMRELQNN